MARLSIIPLSVIFMVFLVPVVVPGSLFIGMLITSVCMSFYVVTSPVPRSVYVPASIFFAIMVSLNLFALLWDVDNVITRDYFEPVKYGYLYLSMLFGGCFFHKVGGLIAIKKVMVVSCLVVIAFGLLEVIYGDQFVMIRSLYVRAEMKTLVGKPITFFWTTYFAASMYLFFACYYLATVIIDRNRLINHLMFALLLLLVLLTQSRTAFICAVFLVAIYLCMQVKRMPVMIAILMFFGLILVFFNFDSIALLAGNLDYLFYGINTYVFDFLNSYTGENSLGTRVGQIVWAFENNSLIFVGSGIGKSYKEYLETWLALYYYRYGLLGMAAYTVLWYAPVWCVAVSKEARKSCKENEIVLSIVIFSFILPVISLSSVITDQVKLIPIFYLFLGGGYVAIFEELRIKTSTCPCNPS